MTVTNTLETVKALQSAGFTNTQADAMATLDEKHASDAADYIKHTIEAAVERTARDQLKWTVGAIFAGAALTIAVLGFVIRLH